MTVRLSPALALAACCVATAVHAVEPIPTLAPFSAVAGPRPPAAWRLVTLPAAKKIPASLLEVASVDGERRLRLQTDASYGALVHDLPRWTPAPGDTLRWRWRLDQPLAGADLRRKEGDDVAVKVCVLFDMPLDGLAFGERTALRIARSLSSEPLPAATICYVWDPGLPTGTVLPNAFSQRVRYVVADGRQAPLGQWRNQQRNVEADFRRLFGAESSAVPPVIAIAVGADADNSGGRSLAWLSDVEIRADGPARPATPPQ
jgi:hypothetical protein